MENLYHIHTGCNYSDDFYVGNTLEFGNGINNFRKKFMLRDCTFTDEIKRGDKIISVHRDLEDFMNMDRINDLSLSKRIELFETVRRYIHNSKIDMREMILEDVRKELYPQYPSRYSCAWLTDEDSLPYWIEALNLTERDKEYAIYEVQADGNMFVSLDRLLPRCYMPHNDMYEQALQYWNPSKEDLKKVNEKEYLLEGTMKLVKRVEL